ncbi:helix-turn-helix transcriptional regulator [Amycolatopsis jiangsuensis]|uniref:DNA-binding CsgD family transcriptional regulator n=1 Tax=Amycolatopsis jiangsuensis TaxID=1181879 RepID=A0A840IPE3_9PSEU|nr:LuxR family transcriptional regulator [Amycolatopsis jiangsuensis]MBB4683810.1 DNA-binding CsgD family transcriptional regulator [Amycolatopsis jiangsuensis]
MVDPEATSTRPKRAGRSGPKLAGRDPELRWLTARLSTGEPATGELSTGEPGRPPVVLVVRGPVGIGKTSLVEAALAECGAAVVCRTTGTVDGRACQGLLAGLREAGAPVPDPDPRAFESWYAEFAAWAAGQAGVVLVVDDAQWCDEPTLRWLTLLARRATALPLRIVLVRGGVTDPATAETLSDLECWYSTEVLDLGPLPAEAVARLAAEATGPLATRHWVEPSGGNPLLLRVILDELGKVAAGVAPLAGGPVDAGLVRSLFGCFPGYVRAVATAIAVLDGQDLLLVARLAEVPLRTAEAAVEMLRAQHVLVPGGLAFRHDPVRTGLLADLEPGEPARLRRTAAFLLSDAAYPADVVAEQVLELGDLEPWMVDLLRDAANNACERDAPWDAVRFLRPAWVARPNDPGLAVQLAETVAELDPGSGFDLLQRAMELQDDPAERAGTAARLGRPALVAWRCATAVTLVESALSGLPADADPQLRPHLEALVRLVGIEDRTSLAKLGERLRSDADGLPDDHVEAGDLAVRAVIAALEGTEPQQAADWALQAVRGYDVTVDDSAVSAAVLTLLLSDEVDVAHDELTRAVELVPAQRSEYLAFRGLLGHWCGDLTSAAADAERAYALGSRTEGRAGGVVPPIALATVLAERGETGQARRLLVRADTPQMREHTLLRPWFQLVDARVRWAEGDHEAALAEFRRCGESLAEVGIGNPLLAPWWFEAACLLAEDGQYEAAAEFAAQGAEPALRWGTARAVGMARLAAGVAAPPAERAGLLEEATAILAGSPALREDALAELELGRSLVDAGDTAAARARLRRSAELSLRSGNRGLLRRAQQTAAEAGIPGQASPLASLSPAERMTAGLAGKGASNRIIAERLFVTVRTVETHLTSVYRKLRITGRAELAGALGQAAAEPRRWGVAR